LPWNVTTVIDLTSEFSQKLVRVDYVSLPILDDATPSVSDLEKLMEIFRTRRGGVYIHCAEGKGRTALVASILLTELGVCRNLPAALEMVKRVRPGSEINPRQSRFARAFWTQRKHEKRMRI
jgi:protein-tyrosine phosphatase